ncbi:MAG: hypothetical protein ACD_15C00097G0002 [uncultured bacterium]|nr:MAG: hypothetical protein ACD_15C00097G0002 [uncultured bacterium]HCU70825.1 hypothetical protein [Candidatus Moranbacteria bacterium]
MKNKTKFFLSVISMLLILVPPMVSLAQFQPPTDTGLPSGSIKDIVTNIMNWLLMIVGIVGVIGFAISGILYLTAAGDETRAGQAKSAMLYSIIGVIVAIIGVVVIRAAQSMLSGTGADF